MKRRYSHRLVLGGITFALAAGVAAPARAPQLAGLAQIEVGQWQLREAGERPRLLCIDDPTVLLQLGHPGATCSRSVIADASDGITVHYTCPGNGHGRTAISVETPRLLRLQTQGVAGGAPFDHDYEVRRIGECTPAAH